MITNKILVTVNVPSLENNYDMFIPINRRVHMVIKMMKKSLWTLSGGSFILDKEYALYNAETGEMYDMNCLIRDTSIRNDTKIILL